MSREPDARGLRPEARGTAESRATSHESPFLVATGIRKRFGAVEANRNANLEVARGEIHALVGENGAGKSTLMRILAGLHDPDGGTVTLDGRDVTGWNTRQAIDAGVGMVHQHFMLVPTLTVAENLVLGQEPRAGIRLDRAAAAAEVEALGRATGLVVAPNRLVSDLSVGEAQRVEVLKVLWRGAKLLILDEPTAVLSPPEVKDLWQVLRRLTSEGSTVVLITHKLDEVMEISDTVTVMRNGETIGRVATRDASPAAIAKMMVGRDVVLAGTDRPDAIGQRTEDLPSHGNSMGSDSIEHDLSRGEKSSVQSHLTPLSVLSVRDLNVPSGLGEHAVRGVSFEIRPGEIFGIAGVEGNGQSELVEAIAGLRTVSSGSIVLGTRDITVLDVRMRGDAGLSHIPEDRHRRGLVLDYPLEDNFILGRQHHFTRRGVLDRRAITANGADLVKSYDVRPPDARLPAGALSGGNQQKVVIAREMGREFSVLLASQPTRGVDVGAIEFIHAQIRAAAASGRGVLLVSADLVEVLALANRIAVMYDGRFACVLPRSEASPEVLGPYMTGLAGKVA
ncbi:MAG TPA: ABC transporter ATP-binding protein [Gemmatimonadaceae bacterium]|nr:ABC transporter ATP-binding protein [Gemmatimonadaceae bacterium]